MTDVYEDITLNNIENNQNRVFFFAVGKNEYSDYDQNFCKGSFGMCHDNETNDWWNLWNAEQRDMYIFYRRDNNNNNNEEWIYHCHFSMTEYGPQFGNAITELIDYLDNNGNIDTNPAGEEKIPTPQPTGDDETSLPTPPPQPPSDPLYPPPPTPSSPPPSMPPSPPPSPTPTLTGLLPTTPQPTTSSLTDQSQTNVVDAANNNTSGAATTSSRTTTQSSSLLLLMPFFPFSIMMVLCYYMTTF